MILCPGNEDGLLPTHFFKRVVDRKTGEEKISSFFATRPVPDHPALVFLTEGHAFPYSIIEMRTIR